MPKPKNPNLQDFTYGLGMEAAASYSDVTLRDLFAAAVLCSWGEPSWGSTTSDNEQADGRAVLIANTAYRLADAMLRERAREET